MTLVVGKPIIPKLPANLSVPQLLGAEQEVIHIIRRLGDHVVLLIGAQATKKTI